MTNKKEERIPRGDPRHSKHRVDLAIKNMQKDLRGLQRCVDKNSLSLWWAQHLDKAESEVYEAIRDWLK